MKLKVYILKKKQIIFFLSMIAVLILLSIALIVSLRSKETINNTSPVQTVHADVNGDKKLDTLYIQTLDDNSYSINLQVKEGPGFNIKPDPLLKSLGYKSSKWPIYLDCKDIDKDGSQEVIIQSSDKNGPLIHIYTYSNNELILLLSGRYNTYTSFIEDSHPVIILGNYSSEDISFKSYYVENKSTRLISSSDNLKVNPLSIFSTLLYEKENEFTAFNSNNSLLSRITKDNFLDASIINVKYKKGLPYKFTYQVRTNTEVNNINIYEVMISKNDDNNEYSISRIKNVN